MQHMSTLFKYRHLHDCLQIVKNHYSHFTKDLSTTVDFEGSEITLNIPEDGEPTKEGWNVTPMTYPVVSLYVLC